MLRLTHRILDLAVSATPNALAATLGDRTLTFRQVDEATNAMSRVLAELGLERGQRVLLQAETTLDHLAFYFATQRLGAAFVPLLPTLSAEEVGRIADYIRPQMMVFDPARQDSGLAYAEAGITVATLGAGNGRTAFHNLDALAATAATDPVDVGSVGERDVHAIFLTSGSTGQPKGVMLSHQASWLRSMNGASRARTCGGRGEVMTFPMYHWAGWNYVMENWAHRRPVHFVESLKAENLATVIDRWRPDWLYCIPAVWERLLGADVHFDASCVRYVGAGTSRFDPALMERISARFPHADRAVYYGSTEFGGALTLNDSEIDRRPGSIGLPYAGCEAAIVDGELRLRSLSMMDGYFELPEQTAAVFEDGWYLTGDLAERDADGFFSITGRRREVIRSGGETIAPAEVELALRGLPGLRDIAVIGLPDPVWGEVVCAALVLDDGATMPSVEALRAHLAQCLAPHKHPRRLFQVGELPRTSATGQLMRSQVKESILRLA